MLVRHCMTYHPVMIDQNVAMTEARKMMVESGVNQLPVVDNKKQLLGLITKSHFAMSLDNIDSLDVWEISSNLNDLKVRNVMIKKNRFIRSIQRRPSSWPHNCLLKMILAAYLS